MQTVTFSIIITKELNNWLKEEAERNGRSKNKQIAFLLSEKMLDQFNKERLELLYNGDRKDMSQRDQDTREDVEEAFELDSWFTTCDDIITSLKKHNLSNDALGQLMMDVFELGAKEGKKRLKKRIERLY